MVGSEGKNVSLGTAGTFEAGMAPQTWLVSDYNMLPCAVPRGDVDKASEEECSDASDEQPSLTSWSKPWLYCIPAELLWTGFSTCTMGPSLRSTFNILARVKEENCRRRTKHG